MDARFEKFAGNMTSEFSVFKAMGSARAGLSTSHWRLIARLIQSTRGYEPASATRDVDCRRMALLSAFIADSGAAVARRRAFPRGRPDQLHVRARWKRPMPDAPSGESEARLPVPQRGRSRCGRDRLSAGPHRGAGRRASTRNLARNYPITKLPDYQIHQLLRASRRPSTSRVTTSVLAARYLVLVPR